jgi:hypothetical protein
MRYERASLGWRYRRRPRRGLGLTVMRMAAEKWIKVELEPCA